MNPCLRPASLRFREKVEIGGVDVCWNWKGRASDEGYGRMWMNGRDRQATHIAWELYRGPVPPKALLCHTCDNPRCVNPEHLFIGNTSLNMLDAVRKGRHHHASRAICPQGHPYDQKNTYHDPKGKRHCKTCVKQRNAEWRLRGFQRSP